MDIELNHIYNMDCMEGMKHIPDESVDAIICDLPYGTTNNPWDSLIPLDALWAEYKRIIKRRGAIVLFAQTPFDKVLGASNLPMLKYEWIWEKNTMTGFLNSGFAPLKKHENILVFSKAGGGHTSNPENAMVYNPQYRKGKPFVMKRSGNVTSSNYGAYKKLGTCHDGDHYQPVDVLQFDRDKGFHPTQKPVDLLRYLVLTYTDEGGVVLDNCMGSGTTAVACIREKRNYIGFELNEEYYLKATERINNELSQQTLF